MVTVAQAIKKDTLSSQKFLSKGLLFFLTDVSEKRIHLLGAR
jgi:hypothetical protein